MYAHKLQRCVSVSVRVCVCVHVCVSYRPICRHRYSFAR